MREITLIGGEGRVDGTMQVTGPAWLTIELAAGESVLVELNPDGDLAPDGPLAVSHGPTGPAGETVPAGADLLAVD